MLWLEEEEEEGERVDPGDTVQIYTRSCSMHVLDHHFWPS